MEGTVNFSSSKKNMALAGSMGGLGLERTGFSSSRVGWALVSLTLVGASEVDALVAASGVDAGFAGAG
jgi:hypothetical protein